MSPRQRGMSVASGLVVRTGDTEKLASMVRASCAPAGPAPRARIVLLAAERLPSAGTAGRVR